VPKHRTSLISTRPATTRRSAPLAPVSSARSAGSRSLAGKQEAFDRAVTEVTAAARALSTASRPLPLEGSGRGSGQGESPVRAALRR